MRTAAVHQLSGRFQHYDLIMTDSAFGFTHFRYTRGEGMAARLFPLFCQLPCVNCKLMVVLTMFSTGYIRLKIQYRECFDFNHDVLCILIFYNSSTERLPWET
jgi:hypothetical protein